MSHEINSELPQAVIFLVINNERKVLLEKRINPDKTFFGEVIIPGGKVEPGETVPEALDRELCEELGIVRRIVVDLGSFRDTTASGNIYKFHAFLITAYDGELVNKEPENSEHIWLFSSEINQPSQDQNNDSQLNHALSLLVLEHAAAFISKKAK